MANLYLTEQGTILHKRGGRLVVDKDGAVLLEVPCLKLDAVLVFGKVQVTTQALAELLDRGIELAFFSRSGRLRGQLTPPKARNIPLRMSQDELARTEDRCLELAREVVRCKIANSAAVLRRFRRNHPEAIDAVAIDAFDLSLEGVATATLRRGSARRRGSGGRPLLRPLRSLGAQGIRLRRPQPPTAARSGKRPPLLRLRAGRQLT